MKDGVIYIIKNTHAPTQEGAARFAYPILTTWDVEVRKDGQAFGLSHCDTAEDAIQTGNNTLYALNRIGVAKFNDLMQRKLEHLIPMLPVPAEVIYPVEYMMYQLG